MITLSIIAVSFRIMVNAIAPATLTSSERILTARSNRGRAAFGVIWRHGAMKNGRQQCSRYPHTYSLLAFCPVVPLWVSMRATFGQTQRPLLASNTLLRTSLSLDRTNALFSVRTMFGGHVRRRDWSPH